MNKIEIIATKKNLTKRWLAVEYNLFDGYSVTGEFDTKKEATDSHKGFRRMQYTTYSAVKNTLYKNSNPI